jgi:hypothetical protein
MSAANPRITLHRKLREAFRDIITGTGVKRARHDLTFDGVSVVCAFTEELGIHGFKPTNVSGVRVQPGERVPAFYIEDTTAYFGWVFWEKFTSAKLRKLWGSTIKNAKGDWAIQLTPTKTATIYANEKMKVEMDIDRPMEI